MLRSGSNLAAPDCACFDGMKRGGLKKGSMKFQSPSAQNESGNLCLFLTPFSKLRNLIMHPHGEDQTARVVLSEIEWN